MMRLKKFSRATGISFVFAVLLAIICTQCFFPAKQSLTDITIHATGKQNLKSKGAELRIFYIEVDHQFIDLKQFETDGWDYDGTLITTTSKPLQLSLPSTHEIKISLKKGEWTPMVDININGMSKQNDLYSQDDNSQYIEKIKSGTYWTVQKIVLTLLMSIALYCLLRWFAFFSRLAWLKKIPSAMEVATFIILFTSVFFVMAGCLHAPWSRGWISRWDTSVFISIGKLMNQGMIPFRDVFDHKGPMLFLANAIGAWIWYPYGIWLLEFSLTLIGYGFCYLWLQKRFKPVCALSGTIFAILSSTEMLNIGNYSESWSLPFCFIALYIFSEAIQKGSLLKKRYIVICGILCSIVMLMRPNCVVPWCVGILAIFFINITQRSYRNLFIQGTCFLLGMLFVFIPVCLYYFYYGAFFDFVNGTFLFNIKYSGIEGTGLINKINGLIQLYKNLKIPFLAPFLLISVLGEGIRLWFAGKKSILNTEIFYWLEMVLYIGVFSIMNGVSGRSYSHYGLILIPAIAMAVGYTLEILGDIVCSLPIKPYLRILTVVLIYCFCISGSIRISWNRATHPETEYPDWNLSFIAAANYIEANTAKNERYGLWGNGLYIQTFIQRYPASKFFFSNQENIMPQNFDFGIKNTKEYLDDLERYQPTYFIEDTTREMPEIVREYINANYVRDERFMSWNNTIMYKKGSSTSKECGGT